MKLNVLVSQGAADQPSAALKNLATAFSELAEYIPAIKRLKLTGKIKSLKSSGAGFVFETQRKTMPSADDQAYIKEIFKQSIGFVTPISVNGVSKYPYISLSVINQRNLSVMIKRIVAQYQEAIIERAKYGGRQSKEEPKRRKGGVDFGWNLAIQKMTADRKQTLNSSDQKKLDRNERNISQGRTQLNKLLDESLDKILKTHFIENFRAYDSFNIKPEGSGQPDEFSVTLRFRIKRK